MKLTLFLLLALTASWTGLVQCQDEDETNSGEALVVVTTKAAEEDNLENRAEVAASGDGSQTIAAFSDLGSTPSNESASTKETSDTDPDKNTDTRDLNTVVMIIIPLVLTFIIIAVIVCVVGIYRRWTLKADEGDDPYLDDDDHEKVPMPMFEDDIPSVMELEMEDLENWMAKDGGKKVDTGQI